MNTRESVARFWLPDGPELGHRRVVVMRKVVLDDGSNAPRLGPRSGASQTPLLSNRAGLRSRRPPRYMELLERLELTGAAAKVKTDAESLAAQVRDALGEAGINSEPLGLLARCHLGRPFEVHTLDLAGEIVRHYEAGQALPGPFERGRRLALHPDYICIEVYADCLICIKKDGQAVRI